MKLGSNPTLEVEALLAEQVFYILERNPANLISDVTSEIGYARTMNALRNHALRFFITDTAGKAEVKQLKAGTYYICGIGYTPQEVRIWNVEVELQAGKNSLALKNENMTIRPKM